MTYLRFDQLLATVAFLVDLRLAYGATVLDHGADVEVTWTSRSCAVSNITPLVAA